MMTKLYKTSVVVIAWLTPLDFKGLWTKLKAIWA